MANLLQFVESVGGASRLVLDYIEEGTHIPMPSNSKIWASNSTADGANFIDSKYEQIPITLNLKVSAASKAALYTALRAVVTEITRENWLQLTPDSGSAIYYRTYAYDASEAHALLEGAMLNANMVFGWPITIMADPFAIGAEETITILDNLAPNWNMETPGAGGEPLDGYTKHEHGAGDAVTQGTVATPEGSREFLLGAAGMKLASTTTGNHARESLTDFITVDKTKHYLLAFACRWLLGNLTELTCVFEQYDNAGVIGTSTTITPVTDVLDQDAWRTSYTVIHPADWDADCAKVKWYFDVTGSTGGAIETYIVDTVFFGCTEYMSANNLSNPCGIIVPSTVLLGDVPAPVDIYLSRWDTTLEGAIYVGGREQYSSAYDPCLESSTGYLRANANAIRGACRELAIPGELVLNGGFETHDSATPVTNWTSWDESVLSGYLRAYGNPHTGLWSVFSYHVGGTITAHTLTSAFAIDIDNTKDYQFGLWYLHFNYTGAGRINAYVYCFDDAPHAYPDMATHCVGVLTALDSSVMQSQWTRGTYSIPAASWPVGTTKAKIVISHEGHAVRGSEDRAWIDDCSLMLTSTTVSFDGKGLIDTIKGKVKAFLRYRLGAAQATKTLALQGNLESGSDITGVTEMQAVSTDMPVLWEYQGDGLFDPISLPTHGLADNAATAAISQELSVLFDTTLATAAYPGWLVCVDDLCLVPVDNGYAALPWDDSQFYIFDSQSDFPTIRESVDGTLDKSAFLMSLRKPFTVDPKNGSNFAILMQTLDGDGSQTGMFTGDIVLKYRPRYLLCK